MTRGDDRVTQGDERVAQGDSLSSKIFRQAQASTNVGAGGGLDSRGYSIGHEPDGRSAGAATLTFFHVGCPVSGRQTLHPF